EGLFGGEAGLSSMRMPSMGLTFGSTLEVYYLTLGWTVICIALLYAYTRTPFGRLTLALRDNEQRIRFLGYNAHGTKIVVFAISAMFAGVAGGLLAMSNETANYNIFSTTVSAQVVLHT
ncbi:branched-chain amino acid ABC transporter permease, partial [Ectothiorhodospiraceae bacterium WFHF3C12]|nr:branched-chain amino acid ABC transporter permease [Ectothiorhodospiraceae bacterium WFHF3C12]